MKALLIDLGRMEYGRVLEYQRDAAARRARGETPDALILVEHDPVITLGKKTTPENFRPQSVPVFSVERGGDATFHGPGQLVGYPIVRLEDHDVRRHVLTIESAVAGTVTGFGIECGLVEGHPGVWSGGKKLCSVGVAVTSWVTYHGFALNVNTDMSYFDLIRPCGLDPKTMTSMKKLAGHSFPLDEVKDKLVEEYEKASGLVLERAEPVLPTSIK